MAYQSQDPLTGLPIEVLIHILSNFSISEFLQLSHIHPVIRDAFRSNAAQICNLAIENDPEFKVRVYSQGILATKVSKWLVPKSFPIIVHPTIARRIFTKRVFARLSTPIPVEISKSWLVGNFDIAWNTAGMKIKLDEPGPQFLSFLEWQRKEVADPDVKIENWGMIEFPRLCGLWTMRFLTSREEKALAVKGFAETFCKKWFPKELLWYYGIEALENYMESA
jgi:hypothetical protein